MSKVYSVGIVGAGFGVKAHLPALLAHPRFEVTALASPNSAAAVARERKIPHAFGSCAEMVRALRLDAVVVASPPFAHHDDVLAALDAGVHVLCEKPFALSVAQAEEMLEAERRAGTVCGVVHEMRWVPARIALKELIANGHLSPLRQIEITQLSRWPWMSKDRASWWYDRARGGGVAGASGSHLIDLANWLAGRPPRAVRGMLRLRDADGASTGGIDDAMFAVLDYGDGLIARVTTDAACAVSQMTVGAHGEHRTAIASGKSPVEGRLFSVDDDEINELQCKPSPHERFASVHRTLPCLLDLYDAWAHKIDTGEGDLPTFEQAVQTQRVLAALGYAGSNSEA